MIYNYITSIGVEVLADSMTSEYDSTSGLYLSRAIVSKNTFTKQEILNYTDIPSGESTESVRVSRIAGGFRIVLKWGFLSDISYHSVILLGYKQQTVTETVIVDGEEQEVTKIEQIEVPIAVYTNTDEILLSEDTDVVFRLNLAQLGNDEIKIAITDDDYATKAELDDLRNSLSLPEGFAEQVTSLVNEANALGGLSALKSIDQDVYGLFSLSNISYTSDLTLNQEIINPDTSVITYSNIWDTANTASLKIEKVSGTRDGQLSITISPTSVNETFLKHSVVLEIKVIYEDTLTQVNNTGVLETQCVEPYTFVNSTGSNKITISLNIQHKNHGYSSRDFSSLSRVAYLFVHVIGRSKRS